MTMTMRMTIALLWILFKGLFDRFIRRIEDLIQTIHGYGRILFDAGIVD
jgi:hypothetical protein